MVPQDDVLSPQSLVSLDSWESNRIAADGQWERIEHMTLANRSVIQKEADSILAPRLTPVGAKDSTGLNRTTFET